MKEKEVDIEKYTDTYIYKSSSLTNANQAKFLNNAIKAYENFIDFLLSNSDIIDYTYLWDIICTPNPQLFPEGINLVILEMPQNDLTDNVNVICPTNHYSTEFFNINKKTLILIKNDEYYEPIYLFEDKKKFLEVTRLFSLTTAITKS